jgi:hypothetical protein
MARRLYWGLDFPSDGDRLCRKPVPVELPPHHDSDSGVPESLFILPPGPSPDLSPQNQPNRLRSDVMHCQ